MSVPIISYPLNFLLVALTIVSAVQFAHAQTDPQTIPSNAIQANATQAVLLKKTDRVLLGIVRQNGNNYDVEISEQARVSLPRDQVEFVGANVEEVYQFKCHSISQWRVGDHFKLTRWCIQNQLLLHATEHFLEVEKQASDHPSWRQSVNQLATELEQKILADEKFRKYAGLPLLVVAQPTRTAQPKSSRSVVPASATSSNVTEHPQLSMRFKDRVQPILMNRCSQSACHGSTSNNALMLAEPIGKVYAKVSTENMKRVLDQITREADGTPRLLSYATKAHGIQREPGIALSETALLDELKNWIRFVENPVTTAVSTNNSASAGTGPTHTVTTSQLTPVAPGSTQLRSVPRSLPEVEFPSGVARPEASEIDALDAQLNQILSKEKSKSSNSSDPFDPSEFNRQSQLPR